MSTQSVNVSNPFIQSHSQNAGQFDRVGLSAADPDSSNIPRWPCQGTSVANVAAVCDTAAASITVRMICFNGSGLPCGSSMPTVFTTGQNEDFGSLFVAVPSADIWRPVAGASSIGIKVDSISAGRWSIHGTIG
jgi:hypothetical protein